MKQVNLETLSLAWSLSNLVHRSSLRSLLTTNERSTCSKSKEAVLLNVSNCLRFLALSHGDLNLVIVAEI